MLGGQENIKQRGGISVGSPVLSIFRFSVLSQWFTFQFIVVSVFFLHLAVTNRYAQYFVYISNKRYIRNSIILFTPLIYELSAYIALPGGKYYVSFPGLWSFKLEE